MSSHALYWRRSRTTPEQRIPDPDAQIEQLCDADLREPVRTLLRALVLIRPVCADCGRGCSPGETHRESSLCLTCLCGSITDEWSTSGIMSTHATQGGNNG